MCVGREAGKAAHAQCAVWGLGVVGAARREGAQFLRFYPLLHTFPGDIPFLGGSEPPWEGI